MVHQSDSASPGNGITPVLLSRDPLATEGEATPGPDDQNPHQKREDQKERQAIRERKRRERKRQKEAEEMNPLLGGSGPDVDLDPVFDEEPTDEPAWFP